MQTFTFIWVDSKANSSPFRHEILRKFECRKSLNTCLNLDNGKSVSTSGQDSIGGKYSIPTSGEITVTGISRDKWIVELLA